MNVKFVVIMHVAWMDFKN